MWGMGSTYPDIILHSAAAYEVSRVSPIIEPGLLQICLLALQLFSCHCSLADNSIENYTGYYGLVEHPQ